MRTLWEIVLSVLCTAFAGVARRSAGSVIAAVAVAMLVSVSACAGQNNLDGDISGDNFAVFTYKPDKPGKYPGLLVLHTISGMKPHVLEYASDIAKHGYVAVAVDYKSGWRGRLGNYYRIFDAYNYLRSLPEVDAGRIGIVGFSLGPRHALSLARENKTDIKVIVSYYVGRLRLVMGPKSGFEAILFLHGDRDFETPVGDVLSFCEDVIAAGKVCEKEIYPGALHAFDHQSRYGGLDGKVTDMAFARSVRFLETHLK